MSGEAAHELRSGFACLVRALAISVDGIKRDGLPTRLIGFKGDQPFMNAAFLAMRPRSASARDLS